MNHKPNIYKANTCPPCPPSASVFEKCVYWLGVGLGSGLPKRAAGTWGTVGGVMVALPMFALGFWGFLIITLIGCLIGSYVCGKTSDLMNVHDDPHIVFDEWVGVWIAYLPVCYLYFGLGAFQFLFLSLYFGGEFIYVTLILAIFGQFILFRIFDILKPFPISWADKKVSGGFGIMLDDILAGILSALVGFAVFNVIFYLMFDDIYIQHIF